MAYIVRRGMGSVAAANPVPTLIQPYWSEPTPGMSTDGKQRLLISNLKTQVDGIEGVLYQHQGNEWNVKTALRLTNQALEFYHDALGVALESAQDVNNVFVIDQVTGQINNLKREWEAVVARQSALIRAKNDGKATFVMVGFAGDLVRLMRGSIAAHENLIYLNEIRPFWLRLGLFAKFAALIDEIWEALAELFNALLKGVKASVGLAAWLLRNLPWVLGGVAAFYVYQTVAPLRAATKAVKSYERKP